MVSPRSPTASSIARRWWDAEVSGDVVGHAAARQAASVQPARAFLLDTEVVPSVVEVRGGGRVSELSQTVVRAFSGAGVVVVV